MVEFIYALCTLTSLVCVFLLYRGYQRSHSPLLFWAAVCFAGLTLNNILLIVEITALHVGDLSTLRLAIATLGMGSLIFGLVWEMA